MRSLKVRVNEDGIGVHTPLEAACSNSPHQIVVTLAVEVSVAAVGKIVRSACTVKSVGAPSASMSWIAPVAVNQKFETGGKFKVSGAGVTVQESAEEQRARMTKAKLGS